MKSNNKVEVILWSKYTLGNFAQKELVRWLGTTLQPVILQQQDTTRKFFLQTLSETPAIYLS